MVYGTDKQMELSYMASQMQIGLEVHETERAHQGGPLPLDLQIFLATAGSKDL